MNLFEQQLGRMMTRRHFFNRASTGIGGIALASLLNRNLLAGGAPGTAGSGSLGLPHIAPRAKRVIYLFMSGAPSHIDLFDHKPKLAELTGTELPASVRGDQRITGMTSGQKQLLCVGSPFKFSRHGKCGAELSELLPHTARVVDDIAILRAMYTEPINHDPAVTFIGTGHQQPGRPTLGSWVSYGLGSENENLPAFIVLLSGSGGQPLQSRYWGSGFLPGSHQGVQFRGTGDPVLFVSNPPGLSARNRRVLLDGIQDLNRIQLDAVKDPEITTRIEAYEMAFRMQTSVPELTDIAREPKEVLDLYGAEPGQASFANNCLLARRLVERGVRFIQLFHRDWDHHSDLPNEIRKQAGLTDRASAALVMDLKQRGLLDETLIVWGGEFGRTSYSQGEITRDSFGRDHHPRCYSIWMAGGGIKGGITLGTTDDFGYNIVEGGIHVHDFHATILHCLGIHHERLTFKSQGRDFRLTDVHGKIVPELLA
ncbi:MAG TPA: DUF1501 domain-containing protein [Methylomirabilota bacterium]|nr:DUF1501 domain-containing protein [Methylomirabilota bacterium]